MGNDFISRCLVPQDRVFEGIDAHLGGIVGYGLNEYFDFQILCNRLNFGARFLFFAERGLRHGFDDIAVDVDEACVVSGIGWIRHVFGVLLPLSWPVVAGVWGLCFVFCFSELDVCALICPPGFTTLPVRTFSLMHYGPGRMSAALSVLSVAVVLAGACLTWWLYCRGRRMLDARNRV